MKRCASIYSRVAAMVALFAIGLLAGCGTHPGTMKSGMFTSDGDRQHVVTIDGPTGTITNTVLLNAD